MLMVKLPANEILWERISDEHGDPLYAITSNHSRDTYYIYRVFKNGKTEKLFKGKNPPELIRKVMSVKRRA